MIGQFPNPFHPDRELRVICKTNSALSTVVNTHQKKYPDKRWLGKPSRYRVNTIFGSKWWIVQHLHGRTPNVYVVCKALRNPHWKEVPYVNTEEIAQNPAERKLTQWQCILWSCDNVHRTSWSNIQKPACAYIQNKWSPFTGFPWLWLLARKSQKPH